MNYQDIMNSYQQDESTFPEFAKKLVTQEREGHQFNNTMPLLVEQQALGKHNLISQLTDPNNLSQIDFCSTSITCFICQQYYIKAVLTICGHSFCQYCLEQYFLFCNQCPICRKVIRDDEFSTNTALNQFVEKFINCQHKEYERRYQQRVSQFKEWKTQKELGRNYWAGMTLDVRDLNHVWGQGTVIRIISMVNQPVKVLKVQYQNQNNFVQIEKIKADSKRLAPAGFYTNRKEIPKYQYLLQKQATVVVEQIL